MNTNWKESFDRMRCEIPDFLESGAPMAKLLANPDMNKLAGLMGLESLCADRDECAWAILVYLTVVSYQCKGESITEREIVNTYARSVVEMSRIQEALHLLSCLGLVAVLRLTFGRDENRIEAQNDMLKILLDEGAIPRMDREALMLEELAATTRIDTSVREADIKLAFVERIINRFGDLAVVKWARETGNLCIQEKALLLLVYGDYQKYKFPFPERHLTGFLTQRDAADLIAAMEDGSSALAEQGIVEMQDAPDGSGKEFQLTPGAIAMFVPQNEKRKLFNRPGGGDSTARENKELINQFFSLVPNSEIQEEELFFNAQLDRQLDFYTRLLRRPDEVFRNHIAGGRLILMLEGLPGTGKTASVWQMARRAERDLLQVNWQTLRGQFVGQSEKNLKGMLEHIDNQSRRTDRVPVVLFNEAESLLSARIRVTHSVDRMENNLISLLLEWMEKRTPFGIVALTSNHRHLIDDAFERRLSHIAFEAPDENTRLRIWQHLVKRYDISLGNADLCNMASHPLTGAEINRALRDYQLHQLAYDNKCSDPELLERLCAGQKWMKQSSNIGFRTLAA